MSNKEKNDQLGMNHSTARHHLVKKLMFSMAQRLGEDTCYQCGKKIEDVKHLSVEHKTPWLHSENPVETFFDLDNVTFSHLKCNIAAARHPNKGLTIHEEYVGYSKTRSPSKVAHDKSRVYCPVERRKRYLRTGH